MKDSRGPGQARREAVTGVVLAGGAGRRMQGADKGLIYLAGQRLIERSMAALSQQCEHLVINANRNIAAYRSTGYRVISDTFAAQCGPLAGMANVLPHIHTSLLLCVPCDSPFLACNLRSRLQAALRGGRSNLAVAHDGQSLQPAFCLVGRTLQPSLDDYLRSGGRKMDTWYQQEGYAAVDFSDCPEMFININRPEDRDRIEAQHQAHLMATTPAIQP